MAVVVEILISSEYGIWCPLAVLGKPLPVVFNLVSSIDVMRITAYFASLAILIRTFVVYWCLGSLSTYPCLF